MGTDCSSSMLKRDNKRELLRFISTAEEMFQTVELYYSVIINNQSYTMTKSQTTNKFQDVESKNQPKQTNKYIKLYTLFKLVLMYSMCSSALMMLIRATL